MNTLKQAPYVLIILDGWGYREEKTHNAIASANTPYWDSLWQNYPHTLIDASGLCVGLPSGQMGNSEVGHMSLGAGRVLYQDFTRINQAIDSKSFYDMSVWKNAMALAQKNHSAIHLMGLLSDGGIHSHDTHFHALIDALAALQAPTGAKVPVYIHAFCDGRDTSPKNADMPLSALEQHCNTVGTGQIASIIGRFYSMDRDKRWDRTEKTYRLLTEGVAEYHAATALDALKQAYDRGESDEFIKATTIGNTPVMIEDNDVVIMVNFRSDRARQLTHALIDSADPNVKTFEGFERRKNPQLADLISMTQYAADLPTSVAFEPIVVNQSLGQVVSDAHLKQLRIAETEKYAHVTFFFNAGEETPFEGEDRRLIPSPKVRTYDLQPQMSAVELTNSLCEAIDSKIYDLIIVNYANPDMVGHTGNFAATVTAIETIDGCLTRVIETLKKQGGEALITADHGNAETLFDEQTQQAHTAHTTQLVPCIYVGRDAKIIKSTGCLSDIAPTLLYLMDIPQPTDMTGQPLLTLTP